MCYQRNPTAGCTGGNPNRASRERQGLRGTKSTSLNARGNLIAFCVRRSVQHCCLRRAPGCYTIWVVRTRPKTPASNGHALSIGFHPVNLQASLRSLVLLEMTETLADMPRRPMPVEKSCQILRGPYLD